MGSGAGPLGFERGHLAQAPALSVFCFHTFGPGVRAEAGGAVTGSKRSAGLGTGARRPRPPSLTPPLQAGDVSSDVWDWLGAARPGEVSGVDFLPPVAAAISPSVPRLFVPGVPCVDVGACPATDQPSPPVPGEPGGDQGALYGEQLCLQALCYPGG